MRSSGSYTWQTARERAEGIGQECGSKTAKCFARDRKRRDGMSEDTVDTGEEPLMRAEVQRLVTEAVTGALAAALSPAGDAPRPVGTDTPGPSGTDPGTSGHRDDSGE